jgi:tetratricopeptide (TPR) repeat protein
MQESSVAVTLSEFVSTHDLRLLTGMPSDVTFSPIGHGGALPSTIEASMIANKSRRRLKRSRRPLSAIRSRQRQCFWISCGLLAFITSAGPGCFSHPLSDRVREADDYYLDRQNADDLEKGLDLLRADVAHDPKDYEAWWRISKFIYYQARHATGSARQKLLDSGMEAGKKAVALEPNRAEGHYWLGAHYDLTAEARGFLRGLLWADSIRREMEIVNRLDPEYEEAGGLRTLARLDYRAPFFYGGDKRLSLKLLKDCLQRYPDNSSAMFYLADTLIAVGLRDEARQELNQILNLCPNPQYGAELAENQEEARARLARYFHSTN